MNISDSESSFVVAALMCLVPASAVVASALGWVFRFKRMHRHDRALVDFYQHLAQGDVWNAIEVCKEDQSIEKEIATLGTLDTVFGRQISVLLSEEKAPELYRLLDAQLVKAWSVTSPCLREQLVTKMLQQLTVHVTQATPEGTHESKTEFYKSASDAGCEQLCLLLRKPFLF